VTPFLFDNNLSRALVPRLADVFPGCLHVSTAGLEFALDEAIWQFARDRDYTIVSKDNDFQSLVLLQGAPPKAVILAVGNAPTSHVEAVLRMHSQMLAEFDAGDDSLLVLREPFTFTKLPT
jgi:predicted nuclease of predicted toxin-antitoxin system